MSPLTPFCGAPAKKHPPDWWPEDTPFMSLKDGFVYRDKDGRWRNSDGVVLDRKARRRAGLPK